MPIRSLPPPAAQTHEVGAPLAGARLGPVWKTVAAVFDACSRHCCGSESSRRPRTLICAFARSASRTSQVRGPPTR